MAYKRPTLEQKVSAIADRYNDIPYSDVLIEHKLTPNQFNRAVNKNLSDLIRTTNGETKQILEEIFIDDNIRIELFRMEEEFLMEQYIRTRSKIEGKLQKIYDGTYLHPENVQFLVYYALTFNNPQLTSTNRAEVIQGIKNLPIDLKDYLCSIGLTGLMHKAFEKGEKNSPLTALKMFDIVYQQKTGDVSLFDLSQKVHLHEWGDNFKAPNSYWKNTDNVEESVYHTLTENNPQLTSTSRAEVIQGIKNLPPNLADYFYIIGLKGLMIHAFEKGERCSPSAVLKVFDKAYQKKTGNISLFDKTQDYHLEFGYENRLIR